MAINYICCACGFKTGNEHALREHEREHELKRKIKVLKRERIEAVLALLLFLLFFFVQLLITLIREAHP